MEEEYDKERAKKLRAIQRKLGDDIANLLWTESIAEKLMQPDGRKKLANKILRMCHKAGYRHP